MFHNGQRVHFSFRNFAKLPHIVDHDYPLDLVEASMDVGFNGSFSEKQLPTTTGIFFGKCKGRNGIAKLSPKLFHKDANIAVLPSVLMIVCIAAAVL